MNHLNTIAAELIADSVVRKELKKTYSLEDMFSKPSFYKYYEKLRSNGENLSKRRAAVILKVIIHSTGVSENMLIEYILKRNIKTTEKRLISFMTARDLEEIFKKIPAFVGSIKDKYDISDFAKNLSWLESEKYPNSTKEKVFERFYSKNKKQEK